MANERLMSLRVAIAGEQLDLLTGRAVWWPRAETLIVADLHWGKAAAFRAAGVPVPGGVTAANLDSLAGLVEEHGVRRLVLLGDLFHARTSFAAATMTAVASWRERIDDCEVVLVRGNHDRRAGDPPAVLRIECVAGPLAEPPLAFRHHPAETPGLYTLAGHIHPAAVLTGPGRQRVRLPCFLFGERVAILPAFGGFTGSADVDPRPGDRLFVIAGEDVIETPSPAP